jgi:hypothetical protein
MIWQDIELRATIFPHNFEEIVLLLSVWKAAVCKSTVSPMHILFCDCIFFFFSVHFVDFKIFILLGILRLWRLVVY